MRVTGPAPLQQCPSLLVRVPWRRRGQAKGSVWGTVCMGVPGGMRWAKGTWVLTLSSSPGGEAHMFLSTPEDRTGPGLRQEHCLLLDCPVRW